MAQSKYSFAGGQSGTSGQMVPVTVPTDSGSWDVADAVGTWDFTTPGEIAQTDATQSGSAVIKTLADFYGMAWAVQADVRLDTENSGQCGCAFGIGYDDVNQPADTDTFASTGPFPNAPAIADGVAWADQGGAGFLTPTSPVPALGEWHTYLLVASGLVAIASYDGTQYAWGYPPAHNGWAIFSSRFVIWSGAGAFTLRNLKAWRIPVPTLT